MLVIIEDHLPKFLPQDGSGGSLLMMPMGSGALLDRIVSRVIRALDCDILVVPMFSPWPDYSARLSKCSMYCVNALDIQGLRAKAQDAEPADRALLIDASMEPRSGFDLTHWTQSHADYHGAVHAVAIGGDAERTRERVQYDSGGRIRRIWRQFARVSWPSSGTSGVFASMVPTTALREIQPEGLGEFRSYLSTIGMLSKDDPIACDLRRLDDPSEFLALQESLLSSTQELSHAGFQQKSHGLWVGDGATIAEDARFIGSVVLHPGVRIEPRAVFIGPVVVGAMSIIGEGAVVARSALGGCSVVSADTEVRERVAAGNVTNEFAEDFAAALRPWAVETWDEFAVDDYAGAIQDFERRRRFVLGVKRFVDASAALLLLLVLSPIMLVMALLVKVDSRGPVFFSHRREQRGGKIFPCLKFRTMVSGADRLQRSLARANEVDGPQFKMRDDPRVTRIGKFLRASNLDELPQLLNVLAGQMSLVGPRPSPFRENQICVPWRQARLSVRPGITGLWQVCRGRRNESDFNQWIYYDMLYVRRLSLWLDAKILVATVLTLGGKVSVPVRWMTREGQDPTRKLSREAIPA